MRPHPFLRSCSRRTIPALALLLLPACTTTGFKAPATTSSVTTPALWQQTTTTGGTLDAQSLAVWWTRFNDPILDQLIDDALANSPDIRTALSKIAESRAVRANSQASLFPSLSAGVSGSGNRTRNRNTHTTATSESYSASLDASWEVDLFGKQRQALSAADADLAQTKENLHAARVSLAAEVASAYVTLRSTETQLDVVNRSLATRQETLQLTQWREQAGTGDALDTQQVISSLEQARASIPSLQQAVTQTRNQLALLSGRTPGSLDTLLSAAKPLPAAPSAIAIGIPAETLRQRPDVRAAEYGVQAAAARTSAARRERLPSLNLSGSIGVEALKAGKLFDPQTIVSSVVGSLTAPIFDAGRIRNTITIQSEQEKQSLIAYESTVLTALSEVENALVSVSRNAERLATLQRAAEAARTAESLASLQYQAGQVDLLTVLDAQRTRLSVEEQVVSTNADELTAHIQLYKALGGGWSPAASTSAAPAPATTATL
ncbi:MAG: efflux transporter outer membrane subunit [Opitutaceae bacterium]|jgi:NodT family efflux transporter outer membrane factor (OMF) lipoprotein